MSSNQQDSSSSPSRDKLSSSNKSLLVRLSESCNFHRKNCHSSSSSDDVDYNADPSPQCLSDMKDLKSIIPMIEASCLGMKMTSGESDTSRRAGAPSTGPARAAHLRKVDPKEVNNLCLFYISVVECTYCPFMMDLLFDHGRGGVEIFPRVHELLRLLTLDIMVDNTLACAKSRRAASSTTKNMNHGSLFSSVANQIVRTCVILLDTIPEISIQKKIVNDLILLLSDLGTLHHIGVLLDDTPSSKGVQVVLFPSLQQDGQKEFFIDLNTITGLLLLQTSVYQILLQFFIMKYYHNQDMLPLPEEEGEEENPKELWDRENIENMAFQMNEENKQILLQCIRYVLETSYRNTASCGELSLACEILSLQSKEVACDLLCLILPDYSVQANSISLGKSMWIEMMDLVTLAVRNFMLHHGRRDGVKSSNEPCLRQHRDSVAHGLCILLRNVFMAPPHPCEFFINEMWNMRSLFVTRLLDCTRYMTCGSMQEHTAASGAEKLHRMILQAIMIGLYPANSNMTSSPRETDMFDVGEVVQMCFTHCNVNNLWSSLYRLLNSSHFTIVSTVLTRLGSFCDEYALDRACQIAMSGEMKQSNKRRKIDRESTVVTARYCDHDEHNDTHRTSFVTELAGYLSLALNGVRHVQSIAIQSQTSVELRENFQSAFLAIENLTIIFDSIYLMNAFFQIEQDTEYNCHCLTLFEKLLNGATHFTKVLIGLCSTNDLGDWMKEYHSHFSYISWTMNRMLLKNILHAKNSNVHLEQLEQLAVLISKWTILYCSRYSSDEVCASVSAFDFKQPSSVLGKSSQSVGGVSIESLQLVDKYLASYYCSCSRICHKLKETFGVSCENSPFECMCQLTYNQGSQRQQNMIAVKGDMEFPNLSCIVLLENTLSAGLRSIFILTLGAFRFKGIQSDLLRCFDGVEQRQEFDMLPFLLSMPNLFHVCFTGIPFCVPYLFPFEGVKFLQKINIRALYSCMFQGESNSVLSNLQHVAILRNMSRVMILHSVASKVGKSTLSPKSGSYICFDIHGKEQYMCNADMDGLAIDMNSTIGILHNVPLNQWQSLLETNLVYELSGKLVGHLVSMLKVQYAHGLLNDAGTRKEIFDVLALLSVLSSKESMQYFVRDFTPKLNLLFAGDHNASQCSHILHWLLKVPFADDSDELRMYAARWVPKTIYYENFRLLYYSHSPEKSMDSNGGNVEFSEIINDLFDHIDENTYSSCGIPISAKYSSMPNMKLAEMFDFDPQIVSKIKSRQCSAISFLSNLAHCIKKDEIEYRLVREKVVLRLFCFWAIATSQQSDMQHAGTLAHCEVASSAYRELRLLNVEEYFILRNIMQFDNMSQWRLTADMVSVAMFAQSIIKSENLAHKHTFLLHFVRSFLVQLPLSNMSQTSIVEQSYNVLTSFDLILPYTLADLVIKKDSLSICELTRFRLNLLAEIKRMERKEKADKGQLDKILGKYTRKLFQYKVYNEDDLMRQTARLCVMKSDDLNILGPILKALLLEQNKAALVFFMKRIVRLKASFGELIKNSEFMLLDELVCELGKCEESSNGDDYCQGFWKQKYKDQRAFHALKRGALFLQSNVKSETRDGKEEPLLSLEFQDINGVDVEDLVQRWIRKYFMRLLVNVTTKWKRGKIDTKISAMRSLRVLLRFLPDEDSAQFLTQILGIVDGCMIQRVTANDEKILLLRLRSLAVRCLSHYTRILLSCDIDCVGQNLCNIVVSLTPLFDDVILVADPVASKVIDDGIELLESLVDGEVGNTLAGYFESVPFLPEHCRLQNVRDALSRQGINFDGLLLSSTHDDSSDIPYCKRESVSSTCSTATEEEMSSFIQTNKLHMALRKRLHYLEKNLNHENDNVRKQCLAHIIDLVRGNRQLFHSAAKIDDASIRFLTVTLERSSSCDNSHKDVKHFIKCLLRRFVSETNTELRLMLASCLGEIGAIAPAYFIDSRLDYKDCIDLSKRWIFEKGAPWKSKSVKVHYELQLVTNYFVVALKAAPTPTDQHKIGFAIQEVLKQLHKDTTDNLNDKKEDNLGNKEMSPWLKGQLEKSGVLSVIEPYWTSMYKQNEASKLKSPPFFTCSSSYYLWVAEWGRFMIERSQKNSRSLYRDIFFSCRSAVRSEAGLGTLEFLLPLLVLDSVCFGEDLDKNTTVNELKDVLLKSDVAQMDKLERQKSVECVLTILQVLQYWAETEVEDRYKQKKQGKKGLIHSKGTLGSIDTTHWSSDEAISVIEELNDLIPQDICAVAASKAGMYAQALRFLEISSRKFEVKTVFDDVGDGEDNNKTASSTKRYIQLLKSSHTERMDIGLAHKLFAELGDRNSMTAVLQCREEQNIMDQILQKKSYEDWESLIRLCELASQMINVAPLKRSMVLDSQMKALLKLGHFDSVLKQFSGLVDKNIVSGSQENDQKPVILSHAINAAWQLGRWDTLGYLVNKLEIETRCATMIPLTPDQEYNFALGKAMLKLNDHKHNDIPIVLKQARDAIIPSLSVVANEDYSRAYPYILRLQCLREIEDINTALSKNSATSHILDCILNEDTCTSSFVGSDYFDLLSVRLALTRIVGKKELEASLWLHAGRRARKEGMLHVAENCLAQADSLYDELKKTTATGSSIVTLKDASEVRFQLAKLKHSSGHSTEALQMIKLVDFEGLLNKNQQDNDFAQLVQKLEDNNQLKSFARRALQATEWMVESGLRSGSEAIERYKLLSALSPKWERAHFHYAKYLDYVLESRISFVATQRGGNSDDETARAKIIIGEKSCHKYIMEAIKEYMEALTLGQKHVFQALPRMLTLWFDFNAIQGGDDELSQFQDEANASVVKYMKAIPVAAFYSVLPQLISRIGHQDQDTVTVICAILRRLLVKFPAQTLWQLSWLRQSVHKDRRKKGDEIFKGAQKVLRKSEEFGMHDLLETSKNLVDFLISLAKYTPKRSDQRTFNIHSNAWTGKVNLSEFVPPVQSALTISPNAVGSMNSQDAFPRQIPRMRAFCSIVQMMSSKARPKKLTAYAIPEGAIVPESTRDSSKPQRTDIGEMHFLVKREARGDLRKDARVQDLNTVINRLFTNPESKCCEKRRLKLRTFSVVCLTEECGILEWVPNTDSFRNLVTRSYNPYASHYSPRRRGRRITNFNDANLRNTFLQCQEQYLKFGNLTKAAELFNETMLKDYPPVFYWWFVRTFQDAHKWFEARTRFALSAAAWAAVGHVIGLGDRHSENILIDTTCGECVHVDFDCIFDKGLTLPRPEVIPFRLTPNMLDAFGPTGANGTFSGGLKSAMSILRDNRDTLLSVLDPFLRDPVIDWKRHRAQQSGETENNTGHRDTMEAKRSIRVIDERLRGMYNLTNPNYKKIKRVDRTSQDSHDEMASMLPLSVEGQVQKMIAEATSHENLVQIYVGWMPWL